MYSQRENKGLSKKYNIVYINITLHYMIISNCITVANIALHISIFLITYIYTEFTITGKCTSFQFQSLDHLLYYNMIMIV
jgi:hypothetical protein